MAESNRTACNGLTRREFVAGSVAAGATLASTGLPGVAAAADGEAPPAGGDEPAANMLHINGRTHALPADPRVTLLDALREYLGLPGTKKGCDHGQCGACTVLMDGRRVNSCLVLACAAAGSRITTIEGLATGDMLHPMQAAFIKFDGFQCGYCTPGQICSAVGLAAEGHAKTDADIREQMSGNLCRCGAYVNIVEAVREGMK
jgi:xanthine dehydrogenase YagT iron-sulfur-binding subunit